MHRAYMSEHMNPESDNSPSVQSVIGDRQMPLRPEDSTGKLKRSIDRSKVKGISDIGRYIPGFPGKTRGGSIKVPEPKDITSLPKAIMGRLSMNDPVSRKDMGQDKRDAKTTDNKNRRDTRKAKMAELKSMSQSERKTKMNTMRSNMKSDIKNRKSTSISNVRSMMKGIKANLEKRNRPMYKEDDLKMHKKEMINEYEALIDARIAKQQEIQEIIQNLYDIMGDTPEVHEAISAFEQQNDWIEQQISVFRAKFDEVNDGIDDEVVDDEVVDMTLSIKPELEDPDELYDELEDDFEHFTDGTFNEPDIVIANQELESMDSIIIGLVTLDDITNVSLDALSTLDTNSINELTNDVTDVVTDIHNLQDVIDKVHEAEITATYADVSERQADQEIALSEMQIASAETEQQKDTAVAKREAAILKKQRAKDEKRTAMNILNNIAIQNKSNGMKTEVIIGISAGVLALIIVIITALMFARRNR